jgi:hypothetical protein
MNLRSRVVSRELDRLDAASSVRRHELELRAELQAASVSAVAYIGRRAMQDVE